MKIKSFTITAAILALMVTVQTSGAADVNASGELSTTNSSNNTAATAPSSIATNRANHVYNTFLKLVQQPNQLKESHTFLKSHIYEVNSYQATLMTLRLENAQRAEFEAWVNKFFVGTIQENIAKLYKQNDTFGTLIARTTNPTLRTLFQGAQDSGFKLETAEGTFFPVIDYEGFANYRPYVMKDIKSYIDIMAVESANPPAKDAALIISWEEVTTRALSQESFVKLYTNSNRTKQVQNLYQQYVINTVYGQNNTPLFDYESKTMNPEAKDTYLSLLAKEGTTNSGYLKKLQSYMDVLKDNNYKLNATVEKFRKDSFPLLDF
ncbi:hypothetical protein ACP8HI_00630 [Paenibacillus sp. FA6]|uniref:hypothetical protein n=1 Tax=Paenibacillus sp. FA6 TaxID=3413029 RepID=UPI003F65CF41